MRFELGISSSVIRPVQCAAKACWVWDVLQVLPICENNTETWFAQRIVLLYLLLRIKMFKSRVWTAIWRNKKISV